MHASCYNDYMMNDVYNMMNEQHAMCMLHCDVCIIQQTYGVVYNENQCVEK